MNEKQWEYASNKIREYYTTVGATKPIWYDALYLEMNFSKAGFMIDDEIAGNPGKGYIRVSPHVARTLVLHDKPVYVLLDHSVESVTSNPEYLLHELAGRQFMIKKTIYKIQEYRVVFEESSAVDLVVSITHEFETILSRDEILEEAIGYLEDLGICDHDTKHCQVKTVRLEMLL